MAEPIVQGWCPGALRPMMSGDGLVVRVRPRSGRLSSAQLHEIAQLSLAYGNGLVDFSNRANVQLRGVTPQSHAPLIEGLTALGLIDADVARESRRNIIVTPLWRDVVTPRLAGALMAALEAAEDLALSGKFGFALDTGEAPVLREVSCDIRIERRGEAFFIRADGQDHCAVTDESGSIPAALELARWFLATGGVQNGRGRMAAHIARQALPERFTAAQMPQETLCVPDAGPSDLGMMVGFEFGQAQAKTLSILAEKADFFRVTPWQMLLAEGLEVAPQLEGIITQAGNPLRHVLACTGAPACPQALQPTRALARKLASLTPHLLHVSGCAKGCAHHTAAARTLVAQPAGFNLVKNGTAKDTPCQTGLTAEQLCASPELLEG